MATENFDPFQGRAFGDLVFLTPRDRCLYIGLYPSQKKQMLRDHPELWKTRSDALRDLQAGAAIVEPAEARSTPSANEVPTSGESNGPLPVPGEDKRLLDNLARNTTPLTIANAEATAASDDEIIIGERRFIRERRVAAMMGYHPRTLQRWRTEQKGPPSTQIGRVMFYEINKLQEWIEREKAGNVSVRVLADGAGFAINPPTSKP